MKTNNKRDGWQILSHLLRGLAIPFFMVLAFVNVSAETIPEAPCMQDAAGFNLKCTANDIQLSEVAEDDLTIIDPCSYPGDQTTFKARFTTILTAQKRHDIGIYFAIDGDVNGDGALTGKCSVSSVPYTPGPDWLDLDGSSDSYVGQHKASGRQDTCGDIDASHSPLYPEIEITTTCVDDDGNGFLDLPYCTSWRQSGANELCTNPVAVKFGTGDFSSGVIPGSPSKCNCNPEFNVPVPVPPAELNVTKTVVPDSVNEPGASVVYSVSVSNFGIDPGNSLTLDSLIDNVYGDITSVHGDITATTCKAEDAVLVSGGAAYTCTFTVLVSGNAGDFIPDIVTASGTDDRGNTITGFDDANVTILGVDPSIEVNKTANPTEVLEPGGLVDFTVKIKNTSVSSDPVTITSLTDDIYGDLNGKGSCAIGETILPGGTYTCTFTELVEGDPFTSETDVVTVVVKDDDNETITGSDSANVAINNVPSSITLVKTGAASIIDEPGGDLAFTFKVTNTSIVDTVTIDSLVDNYYKTDLNGEGNCSVPFVLEPGEYYECTATFAVLGDVGDAVVNTSTASGLDDDNIPVMASDTFTVNFRNVPPNASLVKTAESVIVDYSVKVTNLSAAESAKIESLNDDIYGSITSVHDSITESNCTVPQTLAKAGAANDSYTCNFSAKATTSPTTDEVTAVVSDNEGGKVSPKDTATVSFE